MAMEWNKGYSASYYLALVDPVTWTDRDSAEIISGSINRSLDGLMESASIESNANMDDIEFWVRIYMNTEQSGSIGHEAIFTGLATTPRKDIEGAFEKSSLECYSVLKPAEDIYLLRGWYAPAGSNGADVVQELLSVTPAPISINGVSNTLDTNIVAEDGETRLSMAYKILNIIGWRLRLKGDGTISIEPLAEEPYVLFDATDYDILEPRISISADWFSIPNVFCAIEDMTSAIAQDNNPDSPLSIENRGRQVWMTESVSGMSEEDSIDSYAQRRLEEEQRLAKPVGYTRRYIPDVVPGDLVSLNYPDQGLVGYFEITSQKIDLGYSASTEEEVVQV